MKNLRLLIIAVVLIAIAVILKINKQPVENTQESVLETNIVSAEEIDKAKAVNIKFSGSQISLKQEDGEWILPEFHHLNAELNKVEELFQKLNDMKMVELVGESTESHKELAVEAIKDNEEVKNTESIVITLKNENLKPFKTIYLGKGRKRKMVDGSVGFGFDGQYGRLEESNKVYLLSNYLHLIRQAEKWADKQIANVKADKVKRIVWNPGSEDAYELSRETASDSLVLTPMPEGDQTRKSLAKSTAAFLTNLNYDEIIATETPDMHPGLEDSTIVAFETFGDLKLKLKIGSGTTRLKSGREMQVFRLEAEYDGADEKLKKTADKINAKYAKIVFAVGKGRLNGILKEKEAFSEKKPEKKDKEDKMPHTETQG
ncbi:MAG: DUF4340 domain-containing protein, partial [Candidatus Rifleibacteriota bacterium]